MRRTPLIPVAVAALTLVATAFAPSANAVDGDPVVDGLVSPLSLAVGDDGAVYVSQNFAGLLTKAVPGQDPEVIYADEGQREIGAVSVTGDVVTFSATSQGGPHNSRVYTLDSEGNQTEIADTWAYEKSHNPDGKRTYGVIGLGKSCTKEIPKKNRAGVVPYKGIKDSHPYSSAVVGDTTYIGDAAANAVLAIDASGISTVALLPAVTVTVDKKLRKELKLPKCTQGKTFKGEPVPTDIAVGPDGNLYVTTLGGGLGESLPVGAVYQIVPATGAVTKVAGGLASPVGIAIDPSGTTYISLLFPGLVMKQEVGGDPEVFAEVPFPGDVDFYNGSVYVTETDLTNDGTTPPAGGVLRFVVDS